MQRCGDRRGWWVAVIATSLVSTGACGGPDTLLGGDVAFVNVDVIPMDTERVLEDQAVIIEDGRIIAIGSVDEIGPDEGVPIIEGDGLYLLPGLTEMHAHLPSPRQSDVDIKNQLFLYVANGVTTVRSMQGDPSHFGLRDQIERGLLVGPRAYLGSIAISGDSVSTPEIAEQRVREYKVAGYDLVNVHEGLSVEAFDALAQTGMQLDTRVFRQADFIELALGNLTSALRDGTFLVVIVTFLFLANLRASAITLLAIPLSLLAAIAAIRFAGLSINSMTLGGMAIAVGAVVDDAIVDVENVTRRLRENVGRPPSARRPSLEVVLDASREIRSSIVFATAIVMLVFSPLFFLSGVEGRLLQPLGFAYLISLFASLIVALTVTPALCAYLLPGVRSILEAREPALAAALKRSYERVLPHVLRHATPVILAASLLLALAVATIPFMGRAFLPAFNEGALVISAVTLPGTSLEESNVLGSAIERLLLDVPEVEATARRTGRAELDEHVQGVESAEIDVRIAPGGRPRDALLEDIRERLSLIPGTNITIGQPISHRIDHMLSGSRANVAIKVFGEDLVVLRTVGNQLVAAVQDVPGLVDLSLEPQADIPTVRVGFGRTALARHGLPAGQAALALETALLGREVGQVVEGQMMFPLILRYAPTDLVDLDTIWQTRIDMPAGARVPLGSIATIVEDRSPNFIGRENVQRRIVVTANVASGDLSGVMAEVRERVADLVTLPAGYRVEYGGQFEAEAEASRLLLGLGVGVVAGIFFILVSVFRSARDAGIVMLNLPLALVGGAVGVFLSGGVVSIAVLIGFISLFGIATRNGIMLVSHIRHLRDERGADARDAVVRGSVNRLVPILMTALSTGLALVPVALGLGEPGSEIQAPLALVIVCGLFSSTALNMFVVPAAYWASERRRSAAS